MTADPRAEATGAVHAGTAVDEDAPVDDGTAVQDETALPLVHARGLDAGRGSRRVFAGLDFDLPAGTLVIVSGPRGSGRSLLLLALTGRATGIDGALEVAGVDATGRARRLRRITAVARLGALVDLEPRHTIAAAITERAAADGISRTAARRSYTERAALLELTVPLSMVIEDLDGYQLTALAVVLASLRDSALIVLDDADRGLDATGRRRLGAALQRFATTTGSTVVAAATRNHTGPHASTDPTAGHRTADGCPTLPDGAVEIPLPAAGTPASQHR